MLGTWQFYVLWFMYACGAGAGLMIISKLAQIASIQVGLTLGFVLVAVLAVGNGADRIVAGIASDKIGRKASFLIAFVLQAVLIVALSQTREGSLLASTYAMAVVSALIGANYLCFREVPRFTRAWWMLAWPFSPVRLTVFSTHSRMRVAASVFFCRSKRGATSSPGGRSKRHR